MNSENILKKYFDKVYTEIDFVKKTYNSLKTFGFSDENSIAATCICRDEISQSLRSIIKHMWGEAFNLSSLGGMFFAGRTGLKAAMHHAPIVEGKERYVFYALPHIAIDGEGRMGICRRAGREGDSIACGALAAFQKEMANPPTSPFAKGGVNNIPPLPSTLTEVRGLLKGGEVGLIDYDDIEYSLIRMRLLREIPYGYVPDLLELTKITLKAIQADLKTTISKVVDTNKSDYAVITGIQIHGPDANYVWPAEYYAIVNGKKQEITI